MLILASASPRRHELLLAAGIPHLVQPASVPELQLPNEAPQDFVRRVAEEKASTAECTEDNVILGADTVVSLDEKVFGKPENEAHAAQMLRALSGRDHWVYTGICLKSKSQKIVDLAATRVSFIHLTDREIDAYVKSGEPRDKAGAYAIQGLASKFVWQIQGCYHNVVGLPVSLVYRHLKEFKREISP